jgi:LytS/YehU family sensor histidine kinase
LYRLSPIQKQWVQSASPTIEFLNLQPNNYKLSIKKGQQEKEMTFTIKPQWWQSGIFKISLIVIFALFVGLLSWLISKNIQISKNKKVVREKKLAELQLKALRSQMNPHFVFNSLAAIQYYINQNDLETSDKYLVKFSKLIRRFFELSKDEEILLSEEVKLLTNYLEIEKLRFREKFNFTIVVDPKLDTSKTKIPTMLLQPTVENAVNHGIFNKLGNGNITVEFVKLNENSFQVTILDDGVGYLKTAEEESGKLKSSGVIQNRIYILNQTGNWDVKYHITEVFIDKKDKGTKVTFTITRKK